MAITSGIFSEEVKFEERLKPSLDELAKTVQHLKGIGLKIVLTSGSFDLIHLGHVKYLAKAKELGDVLVVGVDSDQKIKKRKGDDRPMVPEGERLEMLAHQRPVDLLCLKPEDEERWALISAVEPDVLVLTTDHGYSDEQQEQLKEIVGGIEIIPRQATITTSERIRQLHMHLGERLAEVLPDLIRDFVRRG